MIREISQQPLGAGKAVVRKLQLDNGLNVLLVRDDSSPIVAYQTWFRVGSRHERPGKTGMAHLFEHLMFNQTEHLAPGEFDRRLESVGSDTNAATWVDWTYYKENVPREHLGLVVELEADRMAHLVVHDPQVASEREVVASERRMHVEDDVEGFLGEQLYAKAFTRHPYHWPTIGWMADILAFTTDDARAFYRTWYAPNNATLVLVGDLDEDAALDLIGRHYGPLPSSPLPVDDIAPEPAQTAERRQSYTKEVATDHLLIGWKGCGLGHPDHAALVLAAELLAGGQSSRLYRRLVIETEIASSVDLAVPEFRDPGLVELRVMLMRGHDAAEAEAMAGAELARLASEPLQAAELEKARARVETQHWRQLRHPEGTAYALGHYETTLGDHRHLFTVAPALRAVRGDDVRRVAAEYLRPHLATVLVAEPPKRSAK